MKTISTGNNRELEKPKADVVRSYKGRPITRRGRGFSRAELRLANVSLNEARMLGLFVDPRRKTNYQSNLEILREVLSKNPRESATGNVPPEMK